MLPFATVRPAQTRQLGKQTSLNLMKTYSVPLPISAGFRLQPVSLAERLFPLIVPVQSPWAVLHQRNDQLLYSRGARRVRIEFVNAGLTRRALLLSQAPNGDSYRTFA